jgi:hypothetical protein
MGKNKPGGQQKWALKERDRRKERKKKGLKKGMEEKN